jgi:hypothetical protein
VFGGNPYQINLLDLATHQQTPLLKHPTYNLREFGVFSGRKELAGGGRAGHWRVR